MRGGRVFPAVLLGACATLLASGCGGGSRQDAKEAKAVYTMQVVRSSFPRVQSIARPTFMLLRVRNTSVATVPNVAVTIDSFYYTEHFPELASSKRPIWVIESGPGAIASRPVESQAISPPGGGQTAYVNTWALGPLPSGQARTFLWRVVPVKAGLHTVHFIVAAGLAGNAKAQLASGGLVRGQFAAFVTRVPPARHVDPRTGRVLPGEFPVVP